MHINVSINYNVRIKKKKSIHDIQWITQEEEDIQYSNHYETGSINVSSGNTTKYSYSSVIANVIASTLIVTDAFGNVFLGLLNCGDVILVHKKWKQILEAPRGLSTPIIPLLKSKAIFHIDLFQNLATQYLRKSDDVEPKIPENIGAPSGHRVSPFKPFLYGSKNIGLIVLITDCSKVHVWLRTALKAALTDDFSHEGEWNSYDVPTETASFCSNNKGVAFDVSVILNDPSGASCVVSFCYYAKRNLVVTSLILHWPSLHFNPKVDPTVEWQQKTIKLNRAEDEKPVVRKHSVVPRFGHHGKVLCVAVNSYSRHFDLVYLLPNGGSANVVKLDYPRGNLQTGNRYRRNPDESEASTQTSSNIMKPKFCILPHPTKDIVVISSGYRLCCVSLSRDVSSPEDLLSFFLKQTHRYNHELEVVCSNHDYDFIHCSNWRLASRSVFDLTESDNEHKQNKEALSLWFPGCILQSDSKPPHLPLTEFEEQVQTTFQILETCWTFLASSRPLEKGKKMPLSNALIAESSRFFKAILLSSSVNDNEEHQIRLIQCLRFFHQFVREGCAVASSAHTVKLLLQMLQKLLFLVLESTETASPERKLICILILTQTLLSFTDSFAESSSISLYENSDLMFGTESRSTNIKSIIHLRMKRYWLYLHKRVIPIWKEKRIRRITKLNRMLFVTCSIIQEQIQSVYPLFRPKSVTNEMRLFLQGKVTSSISSMKAKMELLLTSGSCHREQQESVSFIFYALFSEGDWPGLAAFIDWFYEVIKSKKFNDEIQCSKRERFVRKLFVRFIGTFGVIMVKILLQMPVYIPNNFENFYDYSSLMDNPTKDCKLLDIVDLYSMDFLTFSNAARCLIIGKRYEIFLDASRRLGDVRLTLFALIIARNTSGCCCDNDVEDILFNVLSSLMYDGSTALTNGIADCGFLESLSHPNHFEGTSQLLQLSVMLGPNRLLAKCLQMCLKEMKTLVKRMPLVVPEYFHLPSPPLFCPQFESDGKEVPSSSRSCYDAEENASHYTEDDVRQKISHWILYFCFVCSAAGISGLLILSTIEEGMESESEKEEMKRNALPLLGPIGSASIDDNAEWVELKNIWRSFLEVICSLDARDRFSLSLRSWIQSKADSKKYKIIQERSRDVLSEALRLFFGNCDWKNEVFPFIVSSIRECPQTRWTARMLASVMVLYGNEVPSLLKEKIRDTLKEWEMAPLTLEGEEGHEYYNRSMLDVYEQELDKQKRKWAKNKGYLFYPLSKENVKCVSMLASVTFYKIPIGEIPFPLLNQFRDQIIILESKGLDPFSYFSMFVNGIKVKDCENESITNFSIKTKDFPSKSIKKKGLFRNSNRANCHKFQSSDFALILYNDRQEHFERQSRAKRPLSLPRRDKKKQRALQRAKSLGSLRGKKEEMRHVISIKVGNGVPSQLTKCLLYVYNSCLIKDDEVPGLSHETLCLILWLLRRDKKIPKMNLASNKIDESSNLSVEDLKLAVLWYTFSSPSPKKENDGEATATEDNDKPFLSQENEKFTTPGSHKVKKLDYGNPSKKQSDGETTAKESKEKQFLPQENNKSTTGFHKVNKIEDENPSKKQNDGETTAKESKEKQFLPQENNKLTTGFQKVKKIDYGNPSNIRNDSIEANLNGLDSLSKCQTDETDGRNGEAKKRGNINKTPGIPVPDDVANQISVNPTERHLNILQSKMNHSNVWEPFTVQNKEIENVSSLSQSNLPPGSNGKESSFRKSQIINVLDTITETTSMRSNFSNAHTVSPDASGDDTLNDITLPNSFSESPVDPVLSSSTSQNGCSSSQFGKFKQSSLNKVCLLKNESVKNVPKSNDEYLKLKPLLSKFNQNESNAHFPVPFDLSRVLNSSSSLSEVEHQEEWALKRIPSNFLKEKLPPTNKEPTTLRLLQIPKMSPTSGEEEEKQEFLTLRTLPSVGIPEGKEQLSQALTPPFLLSNVPRETGKFPNNYQTPFNIIVQEVPLVSNKQDTTSHKSTQTNQVSNGLQVEDTSTALREVHIALEEEDNCGQSLEPLNDRNLQTDFRWAEKVSSSEKKRSTVQIQTTLEKNICESNGKQRSRGELWKTTGSQTWVFGVEDQNVEKDLPNSTDNRIHFTDIAKTMRERDVLVDKEKVKVANEPVGCAVGHKESDRTQLQIERLDDTRSSGSAKPSPTHEQNKLSSSASKQEWNENELKRLVGEMNLVTKEELNSRLHDEQMMNKIKLENLSNGLTTIVEDGSLEKVDDLLCAPVTENEKSFGTSLNGNLETMKNQSNMSDGAVSSQKIENKKEDLGFANMSTIQVNAYTPQDTQKMGEVNSNIASYLLPQVNIEAIDSTNAESSYVDSDVEVKNELKNLTFKISNVHDILELFSQGALSINELYHHLATSPHLLDAHFPERKDETLKKNLNTKCNQLKKDVNKTKRDISRAKQLLCKVETVSSQISNKNLLQMERIKRVLKKRSRAHETAPAFPEGGSYSEMLMYLNDVPAENLTHDVILKILNEVSKAATPGKDVAPYTILDSSVESAESSVLRSLTQEYPDGTTFDDLAEGNTKASSHDFNFHLSFLDTDSAPDFANTADIHPSSDDEEKRKNEIRLWMQRKKRERLDSTARTSVTNKGNLTGRQIQENLRFQETRRDRLREHHMRKRKETFNAILSNHLLAAKSMKHILSSETSPSALFKDAKKSEARKLQPSGNIKSKCIKTFPSSSPVGGGIKLEMDRLKEVLLGAAPFKKPSIERGRKTQTPHTDLKSVSPTISTPHTSEMFRPCDQSANLFKKALDQIPEENTPSDHSSFSDS